MINYEVYDNHADSWVVFIHGMGGSTFTWKRQIEAFSNKYNLLLIDLPGHGKSQKFNFNKKLDANQVSLKIKEVLDFLCITTADFVGLSLGTLVAANFAINYPKQVNSIIFGGSVMHINHFYKCLLLFVKNIKNALPHRLMYRTFALMMLPKKSHKKTRSIFIRESLKMRKEAFFAWVDYLSVIVRPQNLLNNLKNQNIKMLFISGKEDFCFIEGTKKVVNFLKKPELEIIENCGHVCSIEKYKEFNEKSLRFLDSVHKSNKELRTA